MAFLANRLSQKGYDVHLLTYESDTNSQALNPRIHHIAIHYSPPGVFALRRILQIVKVRKVITDIQPDVIISFLTYPNLISILASIGTGTPVIISERGDPITEKGWFRQFKDFIYRFADGYVFQTKAAKDYYTKRIQDQATVIPNPVIAENITEKWMGEKEDIVVNVGRFELVQKRQDVLIEAFKRIADKYPNINLVLYGDGQDKPEIIKLIADYNLEKRVILGGVVDNIYEAIKKARVFVLASDYEGIPNALIEAMTVGLPCVTTDCSPGGAAELVKTMENGILVKAGCAEELASAMEFMLDNPAIAESMGFNAMKVINLLDSDAIIAQWEKFIELQLQNKSVRK